jgi:hypothetical protein
MRLIHWSAPLQWRNHERHLRAEVTPLAVARSIEATRPSACPWQRVQQDRAEGRGADAAHGKVAEFQAEVAFTLPPVMFPVIRTNTGAEGR